MDVYLHTIGCRLNEAELEGWHRDFWRGGHRVVSRPEKAQVMVLNTCAVTSVAARKSRQIVNRLHRKNPSAGLVITGCYAELAPEKLASMAGVDLVVGNLDKERLVELVEAEIDPRTMPEIATEPDNHELFANTRTRAFVKVQDGCRNQCSFCVVTILRGQERSKPISEVVSEVKGLVADGFQEVVVTGVHLGGYGSDLPQGHDLYALLATILEETQVKRLRVTSLEPWDLPENFWSLWKDSRLGGHIHLPLQSGCDSVLRRMARRCFVDDYRALVSAARESIPDLSLTTDLIVGFPGESEQEWAATMAFVEEIGFAHMHIFTYSAREGTRAARLPGRVDKQTQRLRSRQLHELGAKMKRQHLERFVGQTRQVLWERAGEVGEDSRRRWQGYTDNFLRVETSVEAELSLENTILPTTLSARDDEKLLGTLTPQGGKPSPGN